MSIITQYLGASAEDVETSITKVIESRVATLSHIKEVISNSEKNVSALTMRFAWGTNLDEVASDIRDKIDFTKRFH